MDVWKGESRLSESIVCFMIALDLLMQIVCEKCVVFCHRNRHVQPIADSYVIHNMLLIPAADVKLTQGISLCIRLFL